MRELGALHRRHPVLAEGDMAWLGVGDSENVIAFRRSHEGRSVLTVFNLSGSTVTTTVDASPASGARVLLQKDLIVTSREGQLAFTAAPGGYLVMEE